jgi:Icc-related predicted phosphoesterase
VAKLLALGAYVKLPNKSLRITCISDTHLHHNKIIMPETDMIIHAGDFTNRGRVSEVGNFLRWYGKQEAKYKLLVCGNHEVEISTQLSLLKDMCEEEGIQLLHNSQTVIEGHVIFGSPYSNEFGRWAFGLPDKELQDIWNRIPDDTSILITHGPAFGNLDSCPGGSVGSISLREHLDTKLSNLKLHVTGHIHESRGMLLKNGVLTINASVCGIPHSDININPLTVRL